MNMIKNPQTETMADLAALDAALHDFNAETAYSEYSEVDLEDFSALEDAIVDEALGITDPIATDTQVSTDELEKLSQSIKREEIYENQKTTIPITELKTVATKVLKRKESSGVKSARSAHSLEAVPAEFFVLTGDPKDLSEAQLQDNKQAVLALKPLQIKIAEKFENLFTAISATNPPSRYTQMAFAYLYDKKQASTTDLIVMFMKAGLREGTARSQTGQMMVLLSVVKIADRSEQILTLRTDSTIARRLNDLGIVHEIAPTIAA